MRTPYIYNYNLNVQQALFRDTILQVGYVGSQGRKLLRLRDMNQPTQAEITAADLACTAAPCIDEARAAPAHHADERAGAVRALCRQPTRCFSDFELQLHASFTDSTSLAWIDALRSAYTWCHSIDTASDSQDYRSQRCHAAKQQQCAGGQGPVELRHPQPLRLGRPPTTFRNGAADCGKVGRSAAFSRYISGHPFSMNYNFIDDYSGGGEFYDRPDVIGPIQYNPQRSDAII